MTARVSRPVSFLRLDLRGKRADLALAELEQFLDRSLLSGVEGVEIVHGRGTGALKAAVHRQLKKLKYVKEFRLGTFGEGDTGVTIVTFK